MKRRAFIHWVASAGLTFGRQASGAAGHPLSVQELFAAAEQVAVVVPTFCDSHWVHIFGKSRIVSLWQGSVGEVLDGVPGGELHVATLGGTVGTTQQWVPHEAHFERSVPYLVALMSGPLGQSWVVGMGQGAYRLERNSNQQWSVTISEQQQHWLSARGSATAALAGQPLSEVRRIIDAARQS